MKKLLIVLLILLVAGPALAGEKRMPPGAPANGGHRTFESVSVGGTNPAKFDVDGDGTAEYILGDTVPSAANDTGVAGTIVFDATGGYIYFCTATDTWIRVAMATWP